MWALELLAACCAGALDSKGPVPLFSATVLPRAPPSANGAPSPTHCEACYSEIDSLSGVLRTAPSILGGIRDGTAGGLAALGWMALPHTCLHRPTLNRLRLRPQPKRQRLLNSWQSL